MFGRASLNHVYRTVWNQALGAMVAVAEITSGRGKASGPSARTRLRLNAPAWPDMNVGALAAGVALAWGAVLPTSFANPVGGEAVVGQATLATQGNKLTVTTQNGVGSNYSAINWQSFSIPAGNTTYFQQPNASSTSINRVVTNTPSLIFGTLGSNGNLVLVNQSGITVGAGAVVDTAAFTASALRMSDADALSGRLRFGDASVAGGAVSVQGSILARSGDVVLMGSGVDTGTSALVQAPNGSAILAAGQQIEITARGLEGITLQVQAPTDRAVNLGTLQGDAVGIFAGTLKHSGAIAANAVSVEGGKVVLKATDAVEVDGQISARQASGAGGIVNISGRNIDLQAGSQIAADASGNGDGGKVVVLATETTQVGGSISAHGGDAGGNGGFVETSGAHVRIADSARVTTAARMGLSGSWLIDPNDFTIGPAESGTVTEGTPSGDISGATLSAALEVGGVTISSTLGTTAGSANGDIHVNDTVSWLAANNLTLSAVRHININQPITAAAGSLTLRYGQGASSGLLGATYNVNAPISLPSGQNFTTVFGSDATAVNYIVINSKEALQAIGVSVNPSGNWAVGSDINLTSFPFLPLGSQATPFSGAFEGLGHKLSGLVINTPGDLNVGLFGYTSGSAVIRDVGLTGGFVNGLGNVGALVGSNYGTVINSYATLGVAAGSYAGGLVGGNLGSIVNSHATGSVDAGSYAGGLVGKNYPGATIDQSVANGSVSGATSVGGLAGSNHGTVSFSQANGSVTGTGGGRYIGGLVGANWSGTITDSTAVGSILGAGNEVGGLVGYNNGDILNSHATGSVVMVGSSEVGGLVGHNNNLISNSYATGNVTGVSNVGGLVGNLNSGTINYGSYASGEVAGDNRVGGLVGYSYGGTISDSHATGKVTGTGVAVGSKDYVGGLVGYAKSSESGTSWIERSYATGDVSGKDFVGGLVGYQWGGTIIDSQAGGKVSGNNYVGGLVGKSEGSSGRYGSAISNSYATGEVSGTGDKLGGLVGYNNYGTIGSGSYATGKVTGLNHVGGLVGFNDNNGTIVNSHHDTGAVSGSSYVGGLAGTNRGTITNSDASGSVSASGNVNGSSYVGGLVGDNYGSIGNSHFSGGVVTGASDNVGGLVGYNEWSGTINSGSSASATVLGVNYVGGLAGYNDGTINDGHASGTVVASGDWVGGLVGYNDRGTIELSSSSGAVSGANKVGGLVGYNYGTVTDSTSSSNVTATGDYVGGLVGYSPCPDGCGYVYGGSATGNVSGRNYVGGLVGFNEGTISSGILNSYADVGSVSGASYVGGLVGKNTGTIQSNSYAKGNVTGTGDHLGGLVGFNTGQIFDGYAYGNVTGSATSLNVGGLVGTNSGDINFGGAYGSSVSGGSNVGGFVGHNMGSITGVDSYGVPTYAIWGTIRNGITNGVNVSGGDNVGGLVGRNDYGLVNNSSVSGGSVTSSGQNIGGLVGYNYGGAVRSSYSQNLTVLGYGFSSGTAQNVGGLVGNTNRGEGGGDGSITGSHTYGVSVSGRGDNVGGLVGSVASGVTINNSRVDSGSVSGYGNVTGGLVGYNAGTVSNSYSSASVNGWGSNSSTIGGLVGRNASGASIVDSYATGRVSGSDYGSDTGGLVGLNDGSISGTLDTSFVGGTTYASGSVSGYDNVGGLVGRNRDSISASIATGSVDGNGNRSNSGNNIGGLVGLNTSGATINAGSFSTGRVSGAWYNSNGAVGGLVGANYGTIDSSSSSSIVRGGTSDGSGYGYGSKVGGLVGFNGSGGIISNSHAGGGSVTGDQNVGGLVGYNEGAISNSWVTGANVTGNSYVGGLVGYNSYGSIANSYATGTVTGGSYAGGLVGSNYGTITGTVTNSATGAVSTYFSGSVNGSYKVGGLVGANYGTIDTTSASATVVSTGDRAGGLVGKNYSTILNSYVSTGSVSGIAEVGGLVGANDGTVTNSHYDIDAVSVNGFSGKYVTLGGLFNPAGAGQYNDWLTNGFALDIANYSSTLLGTSGTYQVGNVAGLKDLLGFADQSFTINLSASIDLVLAPNLHLPYFKGTFNGNGFTVTNLKIDQPFGNNVGFIGHLDGIASSVSNLGLIDATVSGNSEVGALVGRNGGSVSNSYVTGVSSVTGPGGSIGGLVGNSAGVIQNSYSNAAVNGVSDLGGLVGVNGGTIINSYATGAVTASGYGADIGGLVGYNYGTVANSYASGDVSGVSNVGGLIGYNYRTVDNSYASGSVSGSSYVGGVVGYNYGTVTNGFWNTSNSPGLSDAGYNFGSTSTMTGLDSVGMTTASNFAAWGADIVAQGGSTSAIWRIYEGNTAPLLRSFLTPLTVTADAVVRSYNASIETGLTNVAYSGAGAPPDLAHLPNSNNPYNGAINASATPYAAGLYSDQQGYDITSTGVGTLTINPVAVTVSGLSGVSRPYNGSNVIALTGTPQLSTTVGGETLNLLNTASGTVPSPNVGATISSTASAPQTITTTIALANGTTGTTGLASNYVLSQPTLAQVSITPTTLVYTANTASRSYGVSPDPALSGTVTGYVNGELANAATVTPGTAVFATTAITSSNAGSYPINGSGLTANYGNYQFAQAFANATAFTILPAGVSLINLTGQRAYDGTVDVAAGIFTLGGLVGGQTLTLTGSGTIPSKNVGTWTLNSLGSLALGDGTGNNAGLASNYQLTGGTHVATITAAPLSVGATAASKTYDGTLAATGAGVATPATAVVTGGTLFAGDSLSGGTFAFTNKNAGTANKTVTVTGVTVGDGTNNSNYAVTYTDNVTSTITPAPLSITTSNVVKTYDGTTSAIGTPVATSGTTVFSGDTLGGGTYAFTDPNVGVGTKTVTVDAVTVNDGNGGLNYVTPTYVSNTTSTINAAQVTVTATPINGSLVGSTSKVYDGTFTASLGSGNFSLTGWVSTDGATVTKTTGTYASRNVGSGISVSTTLASTDFSATGSTNLANYVLPTSVSGNIGSITPATVSATGITAQNKVYDGTTVATVTGGAVSGVISGDSVGLTAGSGSFVNKNAGTGKAVTVTGLGLTGASAGNYSLSSTSASTTADITPKALTVSTVTAANKVYDGTTAATLGGGVLSGAVAGDSISLSAPAGSFADKNVGTAKPVAIAGLALTGADVGNYTLGAISTSASADITPKALSVNAITAANKVYDGTTSATLSAATLSGAIAGDSVALTTPSGSFADKNAGVAKPVGITGLALTGTDVGNYTLTGATATTTADITPKPVTVSTITAESRVYDGTTKATLGTATLSGTIAGDSVALATPLGTFADPNVGVAKPVAITGITLTGADATNYLLPSDKQLASADITVRPLSTWNGSSSNLWSDPKNWDALPVGNNVLAVAIPAGVAVVMDNSAAPTTLQSINSAGDMNVTGGNLTVSNALNTARYNQTGGSVTGSGSLAVTSSFSQAAGSIALAGPVSITQSAGDLTVGSITASGITLAAPAGAIFQTDAVATGGVLSTQSANGVTLNNAGNRVVAFTASSAGAGNIALTNVGALDVRGITAANGNVNLFNTGGISNSSSIQAPNGKVTLTANSPLTVGASGISAGGDIVLTATNLTSSGNMTIDGPVTSTSGSIALSAANDFTQNAVLRAAKGIAVDAGGAMNFGPQAQSYGNPVSYLTSGIPYVTPWQAVAAAGVTDFVATFLDKFNVALAQQEPVSDETLDRRAKARDNMVVEGEICAR